MDWQPNQEALKQIIEVLNQSQSPDTAVHRYVTYVSFFFLILNTKEHLQTSPSSPSKS